MNLSGLFGALLVGAGSSCALWWVARPIFSSPVLQRRNFRGIDVPVAAGVLLPCALVAVGAVLALAGAWRDRPVAGQASIQPTLLLALGFGLLGAFDDLAAHGDDRGFRGHVAAMARGRLSTGGLKLLVGGLLAVVVVGFAHTDSLLDLVLGSVLVALAANLGNLLDRAPGRVSKVGVVVAVVLLVATPAGERSAIVATMIVLGAAAGLLLPDLREELMLGDAGSNVIGAVSGLAIVLTAGRAVEVAVVVALAALNVASERISFSKVIASVRLLNALDMLGRRPLDEVGHRSDTDR